MICLAVLAYDARSGSKSSKGDSPVSEPAPEDDGLSAIEQRLEKLADVIRKPRRVVEFSQPIERKSKTKIGVLSTAGILRWTNQFRSEQGVEPLSSDMLLRAESEAKLQDMLKHEYFAHQSPDGTAPGEQLDQTMEEYLLIGENLAKGGFESDRDLVQAWMDSPGHRENILRSGYREIGIAVGSYIENGNTVWLAVQTFGTAKSACPLPNENVLARIEENRGEMELMHEDIEYYREKIENPGKLSASGINLLIKEYNDNVREYNRLHTLTQPLVAAYKRQVDRYNDCIQELAEN